ncbi:hypothetical protein BX600DRAFT_514269 [Xylariales sp. PMI_506]|nr:hypothetical protein BX600DRAFT_514269 [Xylariales sp. PMI_506]
MEPNAALAGHGISEENIETPMVLHLDRPEIQHRQSASSQTQCGGSRTAEADESLNAEENRETSFFLRHFSETPGWWMDLFDLDCYYSRQVPVLARHNPLVKYAACAFAAKQLGRVHGRKSVRGGVANRLAGMEVWPQRGTVDYMWFGMKYYDKSISLLMEYISEGSHAYHRDDYNRRYDDETIVAATILCNYEFLSATTTGWSRHLDGTQSLLRLTNQEGLFQFEPSPRLSPGTSTPPKALRAAFWNFARQDFLASIITCKHTRLNVDDLDMWRAMGLLLNEGGLVCPSNSTETSEAVMQDDMISNALVWLLCKIGNFVAANFPEVSSGGDHSDVVADEALQEATWRTLDLELSAWHEGLPATFQPSARIPIESASPNIRSETWYSNSMCASTMQSYHLARMLLLIHQPAKLLLESSLPLRSSARLAQRQDLLSGYRSMQSQLRSHAIEICSIAQGRPDDGARVHSLQPLYFAGRCLTDPRDQEIVMQHIKSIETDLGWATEYRVEQLRQEWET